jgi:RNA polymerase sigma-70 factor (ECF subfamily)
MHLRKTDALKLSDDIEEARKLFTEEATPVQKMGYRELMALIARLPADARTVFNMYVIEGYSHKEIAETLGVNEATSRSKLQRARIRLQEMIRKTEEEKKK